MEFRNNYILIALVVVFVSVTTASSEQLPEPKDIYINLTINTGARHFDSDIGQNLDGDSLSLYGLGLGFRYKRLTLNADFCINNSQAVTTEYVATTGWPAHMIGLNYYSYAIEIGFVPIRYKRLDLHLYSGLQWVELTESNYGLDYHANFSNSSGGEPGLVLGGNINIRVGRHNFNGYEDGMRHYFLWGMRYAELDFHNQEYGDGYTYEIRIGYKLELAL